MAVKLSNRLESRTNCGPCIYSNGAEIVSFRLSVHNFCSACYKENCKKENFVQENNELLKKMPINREVCLILYFNQNPTKRAVIILPLCSTLAFIT